MSNYRRSPVFLADSDRHVATVVMETAQVVLGQVKNFFNVVNWELND